MPTSPDDSLGLFEQQRARLLRIAYRMLGSMAEAEDVVQDAWLRWNEAKRGVVETPAAFLVRTVTRLCLDVLKSARVQRTDYIGPWLPEPLVDHDDEGISMPLMLAMERLSPLERAAFLLHDVFELDFDEIATTVERDAAACRQLASRARRNVQAARPRFPVARERGLEIANAFQAASATGDVAALKSLLAADVVFHSDGGGKRPATFRPVAGAAKVLRLLRGLARKWPHRALRTCMIDGLPGYITLGEDGLPQTTALAIDGGRITAVYVMRNPDKLRPLWPH
jgi:RNA polymerase sigma-70 factor (ECF subfamily)